MPQSVYLIVDGGIAAIEYDGPDGKPAVAKGTIDQIAKELDKNGYGPIQIPNRNGDSKIWFFDGKYHVETKANGKTEDWQKFASLEEALRLVTQTTEEPS